MNSHLVQIADDSCVLYVEKETNALLGSMELLSSIYPYVKKVHENVTNLYVTHTSLVNLVKDKRIELYSVRNEI